MSPTSQYCTFYLDELLFGVDLKRVQEVVGALEVTRVPLAPDVVSGLINLRGQIVTVVNLRSRLQLGPSAPGIPGMNIVVGFADGPVSMLVDEIRDVVEVAGDTFETPPETMRGHVRTMILGVHKLNDSLLHVLDIAKACQLVEPLELAAQPKMR
jgi:purine-binding chemotaxis protein CheW